MTDINTGMQRATSVVVNKTMGGVSLDGYPKTFQLGGAFGVYPAMTQTDIARLTVELYKQRLNAFVAYVVSVEPGITLNADDAYKRNLTACPLG